MIQVEKNGEMMRENTGESVETSDVSKRSPCDARCIWHGGVPCQVEGEHEVYDGEPIHRWQNPQVPHDWAAWFGEVIPVAK